MQLKLRFSAPRPRIRKFSQRNDMIHKSSLFLLRYRPWFIGFFQACLVICSLSMAWLVRFDFSMPYRPTLLYVVPILVSARLIAIGYFGLLRGWWRYIGLRDGIDILKAVLAGSALFWLSMKFMGRG